MKTSNPHTTTLERLGFSYKRGGAHSSRTIMLAELHTLLASVDSPTATRAEYREAIEATNCLGKRSSKTRTLTFRHLADLYGLAPDLFVFRSLRFFWERDPDARPLLAMLCAYTRDPILRSCAPHILQAELGSTVGRATLETRINEQEPGRFSAATLQSTAQNINASWTQAGHLSGRARKVRTRASATPGAAAYALLLGYVSGLRGQFLLDSDFTRILDCPRGRTIELAEQASRRGWITLKRAGTVVEVLFPRLLTSEEMEWLRESD